MVTLNQNRNQSGIATMEMTLDMGLEKIREVRELICWSAFFVNMHRARLYL